MEHENARWKVLGLGLDDKTYTVFVSACTAACVEITAISCEHGAKGTEEGAFRKEMVDATISQVMGWRDEGFASDHWFHVDGHLCEIRLESYEETERRLMGKGA